MAVNVYIVGQVIRNGSPSSGTFKVTSTSSAAGASCPISQYGFVEVAVSVSFGDTLTFTADTGTSFSTSKTLAVQPTADQAFQILWDTGTGTLSGL